MMLKNLKTVNYWYQTPAITPDTPDTLEWVFKNATAGEGSPIPYFFEHIYVPILTRDSTTHAPVVGDDGNFVVTYHDIGVSYGELADMYMTLYGYNVLSVPLPRPEIDPLGYTNGRNMAAKKIKAILTLNKYKYLKWIDSMGYAYNPLWNVDGVDFFQYIDEHGDVTRTDSPILQTSQNIQTAPYDNANTYVNTQKTGFGYNNTTEEEVSGLTAVNTETHSGISSLDEQEIPGTLHAVTGGDYSHIEKRVRQGNQGITMTTQLLQAERDLVRFNLIQEFFNDVNKQLLVGIYPGF